LRGIGAVGLINTSTSPFERTPSKPKPSLRQRFRNLASFSRPFECDERRAKPFAGIEREKLSVKSGADNLLIYGSENAHDAHCKRCVRDGAFVHVAVGTLESGRRDRRLQRASEVALIVGGFVDERQMIFPAARRPSGEVEAPEIDGARP
jgi:hypothetical protein